MATKNNILLADIMIAILEEVNLNEMQTRIGALLEEAYPTNEHECDSAASGHEWVSADNEVVKGAEICIHCKTIRAVPSSIKS